MYMFMHIYTCKLYFHVYCRWTECIKHRFVSAWLLPLNKSCNSVSVWLDACVKIEWSPPVPLLAKKLSRFPD